MGGGPADLAGSGVLSSFSVLSADISRKKRKSVFSTATA